MSEPCNHAKSIFLAAIEDNAPEQWPAFLEQACGGNVLLRAEVENLLRAQSEMGSFHEVPRSSSVATVDEPISEGPGTMIGPYKLVEEIGEGGFGIVFMAEQQQPVRRKVALKVLKPGMDTRQVIARFEAERQALALMDHPNIAHVLEAGETGSGRPYFAMELVRGVPITDYCDQNRLTTRERLELFVHVCQAVQHAHHKGIIHRDIKPSNVMVTLHDGVPVVKVIDFGIAKALGQHLTDKTLVTGFAQMVGTPMYMSPEQAQLSGLDIDTRSDIYSLGVLLYELLTGVTPFDKERLRAVGYDEMRRVIREEEPPRPSTRLSTLGQAAATVSAQRQSDPKRLSLLLRGELDWIVMKALDKDRRRRYETANELARDVERYLHDEPVLACPPSASYRFRKFARRHKAGLQIAAAAALVLLLAVVGVSWTLSDRATRQAETERTVSAALVTVENLRDQAGRMPRWTSEEADAILAVWQQAQAALAPALAALKTGTANDLLRQQVLDLQQESERQRVQADRKAKLLRDLDEARLSRSNWIENKNDFDHAGAAAQYTVAFAAYDLEVKPGRTEELARSIRAEEAGIREALIVALDDRSTNEVHAKTEQLAKELRALAGAADDDPWRQKYRAAASDKNAAALLALSREARQLSLPASSLVLLAWSLDHQGEHAEMLTLLRWARVRYPGDFWVNYVLGNVLEERREQSASALEEAIGCYTTALALRPKASAAYNSLGLALLAKNQADAQDAAIYAFKQALIIDPKSSWYHSNLGKALHAKYQLDDASAEYRTAIQLDPNYAPFYTNLGNALRDKNLLDEAMSEYSQAIKIDPKFAPAHVGKGLLLRAQNLWDKAMDEFSEAIKLDFKNAPAHSNLGSILDLKNRFDEAMVEYRLAIKLDPNLAPPHVGLGAIHSNVKHDYDGAIIEFREAIRIDPDYTTAHFNLGVVLQAKKQFDEAMAEYRKAIDLDPNLAPAHFNLGVRLHAKRQFAEASAEYRRAIDLGLQNAPNLCSLGTALMDTNEWDAAIAVYKKAITLDPKFAPAHYSLGRAMEAKNQLGEASAEYKTAIDLQPDYAEAHCNLAGVFRLQGQLSASLDFYKRGHAIGSKRQDWHYPSAQWVANAERLVRLEAKLADVLAGKTTPTDNRERLGLGEVCGLQRRHVAAARLYADAFSADPKLADDLKAGHRYNAACFAALAAAGQGTDAGKLDDQEHRRLRQQALAWLRADLDLWSKRLEGGKPEDRQVVRNTLDHWQRDSDLAGVRETDALKKLSAAELEAWRKLWGDVAEVLKKAGDAK
ncbi:MAG TPA: tetratricopeptide repeat protein [Gemmataceae bacterium]|nr:tetratricopeptide repeat protein [Gemmataceae bacterium]